MFTMNLRFIPNQVKQNANHLRIGYHRFAAQSDKNAA
jgi:hypothetical protein